MYTKTQLKRKAIHRLSTAYLSSCGLYEAGRCEDGESPWSE